MMSEKKQKNVTNNNIINRYTNKKGFGLNSENYLEKLKTENFSLNSQIKKLNDTIIFLRSQISNYEKEKNKILLLSNKKDYEIKEIRQKLSQTKLELEEFKQKLNIKEKEKENNSNNNLKELKKIEEFQKAKELNTNLLSQLQNKITDLELLLKKKEGKILSPSNSAKNIFLSPLKNLNNISIFFPSSLNKLKNSQSASDLFLTGTDELTEIRNSNQRLLDSIKDLKQEISAMANDRLGIQVGLDNLTKERNNLVKLLKNKNEEITNKLEQQNKLNKDLLEQLDKNEKLMTFYRKIKIKNKNMEINQKLLEDVVFKQEEKVLKLSKSYQKIKDLSNTKDEEINKNKKYILTLENTIKDLKSKFEKLKKDKKEDKIKELELKIKLIQKKNERKNIQNNKIFENNNNYGNNIHNINYFIESPRFNYKNDYFKKKQKLFRSNIQHSPVFSSINLRKYKNIEINKSSKKIIINNYYDKNKSNLKHFNENLRFKIYNKNKINTRGKLLENSSSYNEIKKRINHKPNISNSLNLNKKIINFSEDLKEKENIDQFKSFFNKFLKELEND